MIQKIIRSIKQSKEQPETLKHQQNLKYFKSFEKKLLKNMAAKLFIKKVKVENNIDQIFQNSHNQQIQPKNSTIQSSKFLQSLQKDKNFNEKITDLTQQTQKHLKIKTSKRLKQKTKKRIKMYNRQDKQTSNLNDSDVQVSEQKQNPDLYQKEIKYIKTQAIQKDQRFKKSVKYDGSKSRVKQNQFSQQNNRPQGIHPSWIAKKQSRSQVFLQPFLGKKTLL